MTKTALQIILTLSFYFLVSVTYAQPKERYPQADIKPEVTAGNDTVYFNLKNPLYCPIRYKLSSQDKDFIKALSKLETISLPAKSDTIIKIPFKGRFNYHYSWLLGSPKELINKNKVSLPFPKGKSYKINQGHNGAFSHKNKYSRYALDLDMKIGDTVCAADNGYVVGVVKDYKGHGSTNSWADYANFITVYHPHSGLYTQYVHLKYNGNLVKVGDAVTTGQPIGLSGNTGWTNGAHLHFNVLVPVDDEEGFESTPIDFLEGYNGAYLKPNTLTKK